MKHLLTRLMFTACIFLTISTTTFSQFDEGGPGSPVNPDEEVAVPIDDGIVLLLLAGVAYGLRKGMVQQRKKVGTSKAIVHS